MTIDATFLIEENKLTIINNNPKDKCEDSAVKSPICPCELPGWYQVTLYDYISGISKEKLYLGIDWFTGACKSLSRLFLTKQEALEAATNFIRIIHEISENSIEISGNLNLEVL